MREVAKMANVSIATVSMVLNGNPRISKATQLRVQRVINKLGYRPNPLAQSLSSRYTRTLSILLPPLRHAFADLYFGEVISGVCDRAGKLGYRVMLDQAKPDFIKDRKHIELFERRFVDGVLCLGCNDRHHFLEDFIEPNYPVIVVNNYFKRWNLDYVVCDYSGGAEQAMRCLMQMGHRRIGLITAAPEVQTTSELTQTYHRLLTEAGCPADDTWIEDGAFTEEGGAAATERLLARHPDLTAIFAGNDKMAIGAIHYLHQQGLRVPEQVSVVGFDDLKHSAYTSPTLTTVHLPLYEIGVIACDRLIERVRGRAERVAERLPTYLVLRGSTALAPTGGA
ncbi:MAG TPA: LacI family DNA-binding transcriptional regulator [Phycisphaeraceae bacterium]